MVYDIGRFGLLEVEEAHIVRLTGKKKLPGLHDCCDVLEVAEEDLLDSAAVRTHLDLVAQTSSRRYLGGNGNLLADPQSGPHTVHDDLRC